MVRSGTCPPATENETNGRCLTNPGAHAFLLLAGTMRFLGVASCGLLLGTMAWMAGGCSDDPDADPPADAGASPGGGESGSGGVAHSGSAGTAGGGSQAVAGSGNDGGGGASGGYGGELSLGGQGGEPGHGGQAGDISQGGEGGLSGEGGEGGAPAPGLTLACPPVGEPYILSQAHDHPPAERELVTAFGCAPDSMRGFSVTRFTLTSASTVTWWSPHTLEPIFDAFRLEPDCGASGHIEIPTASELQGDYYVQYPGMVSELLPPGTYTRIACESSMYALTETPPAAATNIDCAHATPLTFAGIDETRLLEPSRFYSFNVPPPEDGVAAPTMNVTFATQQTNASAVGILKGIANGYPATEDSLFYLLDSLRLSYEALPPGDYCLEIKATQGVKYKIMGRLQY
jgi:hypothetical protein